MSDDLRRVTTEEERERFHAIRRRGGLCAACSRVLGAGEPVYWEDVVVDIDRSAEDGVGHYWSTVEAPLGAECASPGFVREMEGREPERCAGCGRAVFYRTPRSIRRRPVCSKRCQSRANRADQRARQAVLTLPGCPEMTPP